MRGKRNSKPKSSSGVKKSKDAYASLPSVSEQYTDFIHNGPVKQLMRDVTNILSSPEHNPYGGSLPIGTLQGILQRCEDGRYGAFFEKSKCIAAFLGLLSGYRRVVLFQWQAPGAGSKEWRVRLQDLPPVECEQRDKQARQAVVQQRSEWPEQVHEFLKALPGPCKFSTLLRHWKRKKIKVPKRPIMMKVLAKQPWLVLAGDRSESNNWTLMLKGREGELEAAKLALRKEKKLKHKKKAREAKAEAEEEDAFVLEEDFANVKLKKNKTRKQRTPEEADEDEFSEGAGEENTRPKKKKRKVPEVEAEVEERITKKKKRKVM